MDCNCLSSRLLRLWSSSCSNISYTQVNFWDSYTQPVLPGIRGTRRLAPLATPQTICINTHRRLRDYAFPRTFNDASEFPTLLHRCLLVKGQRHKRFPGVPRTKSSILLTIRIIQIRWGVTGLATTLDAFSAIPRRAEQWLWQQQ
jgi:hypothetical protein